MSNLIFTIEATNGFGLSIVYKKLKPRIGFTFCNVHSRDHEWVLILSSMHKRSNGSFLPLMCRLFTISVHEWVLILSSVHKSSNGSVLP